jgi:hypothetical protein
MPTLNYENVGALVEYDYLQGTISALYPDDDTADVSGVCGNLSRIPIFYHCHPDSVARSNGALEGSASGFREGDLVVVLKTSGDAKSNLYSLDKIKLTGSNGKATGPGYFVVGHYNGVRKCAGSGVVMIYAKRDYPFEEYMFIWDVATNSYLKDAFYTNHYTGAKVTIHDTDYPRQMWEDTQYPYVDPMLDWEAERFSSRKVTPTRIVESQNMFVVETVDFGMAKVKPGDYVYSASYPWLWSTVKSVAGCIIITTDLVVRASVGGEWFVSASLPLYYISETWRSVNATWPPSTADGSEICWTPIYNPYTSAFETAYVMHSPDYSIEAYDLQYEHIDIVNNTLETVMIPGGSFRKSYKRDNFTCGSVGYPSDGTTGTFCEIIDAQRGNWIGYVNGVSVDDTFDCDNKFEHKQIFKSNVDDTEDYIRDYLECSREIEKYGTNTTVWPPRHDFLKERIVIDGNNGCLNPLIDNVDFECIGTYHFYPLPVNTSHSGDCIPITGEMAIRAGADNFQFYTYRGYERNTFAQCRSHNSRSDELEEAIINMIDAMGVHGCNITGIYYSGKREADRTGNDMIALLNGVRGYHELLTEDDWCMSSSAVKAEFLAENGLSRHEEPDGNLPTYVGMEVICTALDTVSLGDIVAGWMSSPEHAIAITEPSYKVAGWAYSTYGPDITQIVYGAGTYNHMNGTYSTGNETVDIPAQYRGHVRIYVVRMTPKPE